MQKFIISLFIVFVIGSCQTDNSGNLEELNLLEYGVPATILAPPEAEVTVRDLVFHKDLTVKKGRDFNVQIFYSDATTINRDVVVDDHLEQIKDNRYFNKIIKEDPDGFIYEMALDTAQMSYGFKHIRIQGDYEYIFQSGLSGIFSLEEVEKMYKAVQ